MKPIRLLAPLFGSAALLLPARAVDVIKANNISPLNTAASWATGIVPGPDDVAVWDSTVTAPNSSPISGNLTWMGIRIGNVGGARNTTNANFLTIGATGASTLTLGSAGIDMSAAFQTLRVQTPVSLVASQTWNVANANNTANSAGLSQNEDLAFISTAANALFNLGGFSVVKDGVGVAAYSSGYTIANGSFDVNAGVLHFQGGGNRVTTIDSDVTFSVNSGATLRFAAQSGAGGITTVNNGAITLNGGSTFALHLNQANAINLNGNINVAGDTLFSVFGGNTSVTTLFGSLIGAGNIAYRNIAVTGTPAVDNVSAFLRLAGDNSGYSGTLTLDSTVGSRRLRLTSPTAGSAAANWVVNAGNVLEVEGVSVQLGTLNGAGSINNPGFADAAITVGAGTFTGAITDGGAPLGVTKVGPGVLALTAANTYSGPTQVQGGTLRTTTAQTGGGAVDVAAGTTLGVSLASAGSTFNASSFTLGGATLTLDLGTFGNPTAPVVTTQALTLSGSNLIQYSGTGLSLGTIRLIDYTGVIGGAGFASLSLMPVPRIVASLVNNVGNTSVDLQITALDLPKWTGAMNGNWDIDNGTGTGTPNWREVVSGNVTRYLENAAGRDNVLFDDSATGTGDINLTTTLSPTGVTVNNAAKTYTFLGVGKLSGPTSFIKQGAGTLIIANTGGNDYTGTTTISGGNLVVGDGATAGAGQLGSGAIFDNATLTLNRADDFTLGNAISGSGALVKNGPGTASVSGVIALTGGTTVNVGALLIAGLGDITGSVVNNSSLLLESTAPFTGTVSGPGAVIAQGAGTKQIAGGNANTNSGGTFASAGLLQLNKPAGTDAIGGDLFIDGTGRVALLQPDQIPDTASVTFTSNGGNTTFIDETVANVSVLGGSEASQFQAQPGGLVITDLLTISAGVFAVASNASATAAEVNISGGILRIAANGNPSTLNVGASGITATGGTIQVGQGTGAFDAVLNLGGNYTGSGTVNFNRGNFFGANLRQINLGDALRTFEVIDGFTTIRPDIVGTVGLTKTGAGTLTLVGAGSYPALNVTDGIVNLDGALANATLNVTPPAAGSATVNISESQTLAGLNIGNGSLVTLTAEAAPGAPAFAPQAVPEPGAVSLLALGALTLLRRRRWD